MSPKLIDNDSLEEAHVDLLDDVRRLHITYSRLKPSAGTCFVEHRGGLVEVFEVDRFLIEHLLQHLEHREA
jgi:hypothetical protein